MKIRSFGVTFNLLNCASIFLLLLVGTFTKAIAAPAPAATPTPPIPDCHMNNPGDAEGLLRLWLNGSPPLCTYDWSIQIDPAFHSWPAGSMNKPVVTAAFGLFKSGPDANLDWLATNPNSIYGKNKWKPVANPTGYKISYVNWWIWYLASQVGEDPKDPMYLGASFNGPPEGNALKYFKGTEEFSNFYDTADLTSVVAVRYWAYKYGYLAQDPNKVTALKKLTRKYLRANLAVYGMAAGENPAYKYDLGRTNPDPTASPVPPRTPVPGLGRTSDTQFDPYAPRTKNGLQIYNGHFIALAGARSELGGHWNYDYRALFYDRAIGQFSNFIFNQKIRQAEFYLLDTLETLWAPLQTPDSEGNLYGLTADDRDDLVALLQTCYRDNLRNTICSGTSFTSNFQNWLKNTFQPWLGNIRVATTFRLLGANGWRASMMAENTNGNTTNIYAEYYKRDAQVDGGTHTLVTFLFPWNDRNGGIPGECSLDTSTGLITAYHKRVDRNGRTVHPAETVYMNIPTEPPLVQLVLSAEAPAAFGTSAVAKSLTNVFTPYGTDFGSDVLWVGNTIPEGGVAQGANENWTWVEGNPLPYTEADVVHLSSPVAGMHQHFFTGATESLSISAGDILYVHVYLDPSNPPSELMLQWFDPSDPYYPWEHRAYWGANLLPWGSDGQNSRRYMGSLPAAGSWVRLDVPASLVGLEGKTITGMAFTLFDGQAAWDQAGTNTLTDPIINVAPVGTATQSSTYTASPAGGPATLAIDGNTNGNWFASSVTSTNYEYQPWWQVDLGASYAIDSINVWNRSDCCADRLSNFYILVSEQPFASTNLVSTLSQPGVTGYYIVGQGGYPTTQAIQRTGRYVRVQLTGTNYLSLAEVEVLGRSASSTAPPSSDVVWIEDSLPPGSTIYVDNDAWIWNSTNPTPFSGNLANQSSNYALMHQHYFTNSTSTLQVNTGDKMVAYVYLDPQNLPSEIMLQWHDPLNGWDHRAKWGGDQLAYFGPQYNMGALPAAGQWIRLEVPANVVGLEGRTVDGLAFSLYGGTATWDHVGKRP